MERAYRHVAQKVRPKSSNTEEGVSEATYESPLSIVPARQSADGTMRLMLPRRPNRPVTAGVLSIFDMYAGEKLLELLRLLLDDGTIPAYRRRLQGSANLADGVEAVTTAVAAHAMAEGPNGFEVVLGQRGSEGLEILSPVVQKHGNNVLKIFVDRYGNAVRWFDLWQRHR